MKQYLDLIKKVLNEGTKKEDLPRIRVREKEQPKRKTTWDDENFLFME